ncbi:MAG: hypothetical protein Q4G26_15825 [Paracoccus sp. (in: a-proteobacteria)]|nr:hypothetical protein [Paracoccus sp. (in: a-proteobacteria)]
MAIQLTQPVPGLREHLRGFFARIGQSLVHIMEVQARVDQIEALHRKSDRDLERLGITRDEIPRYVFRDKIGM